MSSILEGAHAICRDIAREAVWHGDRCTWIAAVLRDSGEVAFSTLGPDVYEGLPGVALVLAECAELTGDRLLARTALGALRQAREVFASDVPAVRRGLYDGAVGLALTAARTARVLQDDEPQALAREALGRDPGSPGAGADLISGDAGIALGLLVLSGLLDRPGLVDDAARAGRRLLVCARRRDTGISWPPAQGVATVDDLTGLGHGASGVGLALIELWRVTGNDAFLAAAENGFAYERQWLSTAHGNWRDLRSFGDHDIRGYVTAWCHGAAGIALARRAWLAAVPRATAASDELATALDTTERLLRASVAATGANLCLCHGVTGNAEILRLCRGSDECSTDLRDQILERVLDPLTSGAGWACGVPGQEPPTLMLGVAGIAHFLLRSHDPRIPPLLAVSPRDWRVAPDHT